MPSKGVAETADQSTLPAGWQAPVETAPSQIREDEPRLARWVGTVGVFLLTVGSAGLFFNAFGRVVRVGAVLFGPVVGTLCVVGGLGCLLFHAASDRDLQVRRTYGVFGFAMLAAAILITALPIKGASGTQFLPWGLIGLTLCLFFLMPFVRNETDVTWHNAAIYLIGGVGTVLALTGFIGGNVSENFLLHYGLLLIVAGFGYLWAFVGMRGTDTETGYRASLGIGLGGLLVFLVALGRSALPELFYSWHWIKARPEPYLVPSGLLLMGLGLLYLGLSVGTCSDNRLVVMTRRELAAFFYSPVAYIVLVGLTLVGLWHFTEFVSQLLPDPRDMMQGNVGVAEPIIWKYVVSFWPILTVLFVVPVLTMRLLSEEQRTGTLEVLLTAPVGEPTVVLSKFFATFILFLLVWAPWGLYLVSLRAEGGEPFEYSQLLSFFFALACSGAAFVAMGEFFSSLTRNQIAAAILTFVGMVALFGIYIGKELIEAQHGDSVWVPILKQASFVDLWLTSMQGILALRYLVFQVSAAIFWLYLSVKVLESRKWR